MKSVFIFRFLYIRYRMAYSLDRPSEKGGLHGNVQDSTVGVLQLPGHIKQNVLERSSDTTLGLVFLRECPGFNVLTSDLVLEEVEGGIAEVLEECKTILPIKNIPKKLPKSRYTEDLLKAGRQGWVRVVVVRGEQREVTYVHYLPPPGSEVEGRPATGSNMKCMKWVQKHLEKTGNSGGLERRNFSFSLRALGLGKPYEVVRKSTVLGPVKAKLGSFFLQYFVDSIEVDPNRYHEDGALKRNRNVMCKLCSQKKLVSYEGIWMHMKSRHLPPEDCPKCCQEFPAINIKSHVKMCGGGKDASVSGITKMKFKDTSFAPPAADIILKKEISEALNCPKVVCKNEAELEETIIKQSSKEKVMISLSIQVEGKKLKLMVNTEKRFKKAMKILASKVKKKLSGLVFRDVDSGMILTGKEIMGKLEGTKIEVEMLNNE